MARSFAGGSPPAAYLSTSSLPVIAPPFSVAYWFNVANVTDLFLGWSTYRSSAIGYYFVGPRGDSAGDPIEAIADDGSGVASTAATSTSFSANTWQHACGVFASTSSVSAYLNGGGKATSTVTRAPVSLSTMAVGRLLYLGSALSGGAFSIAYLGVWNAALTDDQVASLAAGYHPRTVRPGSLVACWDLGGFAGEHDLDRVGGYNLTPSGSPTWSDSPRIIYPQGPTETKLAYITVSAASSGQAGRLLMGLG